MSQIDKTYYQQIDTKFFDSIKNNVEDDLHFISSICLACCYDKKSEEGYIDFLSNFIVGFQDGNGDIDIGITIGSEATADFIYEEGFIAYDLIRGKNGVNIIAFEDMHSCLVVEERRAILEVIKTIRREYKLNVSIEESPLFIETYVALAKKYGLEV